MQTLAGMSLALNAASRSAPLGINVNCIAKGAIAFLASEESSYITGQIIELSGGFESWKIGG